MTNAPENSPTRNWKVSQVYAMAGICLVIGVVLGYLFRGSGVGATHSAQSSQMNIGEGAAGAQHQMPSLEQLKQMADKKAQPLLEKLKTNPNDSNVLNELGTIYKATHQFKEAMSYYEKAVQADPKNVGARTDLASCMYYEGDVEGALKQLEQSLTYDSKDANSLFNLGMIRWKGKGDSKGAAQAWDQLLKANPKLSTAKKTEVQNLLAEVRRQGSNL
jgi:cytochrome c-type biogenesis protein CcmH/NrfG